MVILGRETANESDWVMVGGIIRKGSKGSVEFSVLLGSPPNSGRNGIAGSAWLRCRCWSLLHQQAVGLELQLTGCTGVDVQGSTQLARLGSDRGTWLAGKGGVGRRESEIHRLWGRAWPSPRWWDCPSITQGCLPARLTDPDDESVPYIPPISILCDRFQRYFLTDSDTLLSDIPPRLSFTLYLRR